MERESDKIRKILEGFIRTAEAFDDASVREALERGPIAKMAELLAETWQQEVSDSFGRLVILAVAMARKLPPEVASVDPTNVAFGVKEAWAVRDLDRGRGPPASEFGTVDGREAVYRLGDFVADREPMLRSLAIAICERRREKGTFDEGLGAYFMERIDERWPDHFMVTIQRWALAWRASLEQQARASKGGAKPRAPTGPAGRVVAAVLEQRPKVRTLGELVAALREVATWGTVEVETVSLRWDRARRTWAGELVVYVGEELHTIPPEPLRKALDRQRKPVA